jgi:hypothetical protein
VGQELTAHPSALEQNERGERQKLGQYQPRDAATTTQINDVSVVGNAPCKGLGKTQGVQEMLFKWRWANRADALRLDEASEQYRRQVSEREPRRRRGITRQ